MKKVLPVLSLFCLVFLFSCREDNSKKSFSEIIKEDSSRKEELIHVADSIKKQLHGSGSLGGFEVKGPELNSLRDDMPGKIKLDKKYPPIMSVRIGDLLEIIDLTPKPINFDNRIVFVLGTYKTQAEVDQYNLLAGTKYVLKDLEHVPNLFVGWESFDLSASSLSTSGSVYAVSYVCPPPYDGTCNSMVFKTSSSSAHMDSASKIK